MAKGVKKIQITKGLYYPDMSVKGQRVTLKPDQWVYFGVEEWLPDTTAEDKKKEIIWMRQTNDKKIIINQAPSKGGYKFLISKQFCGSYHYYIEASLSGKRDPKNNTGLYVKGWCEPKIVSSKWTTQRGSKVSIKNQNKVNYISYGHIVYLNLITEGLNGNNVIIEVWNQQYAREDKPIHVYTDVQVIDGEVNLKIENTYSWMAHVENIQNVEEFYIKVKDSASKKYIKDDRGDDLHAIYLNVKNKVVTTNANVSKNQTPTKVYKPDVSAVRYEPCKFEVINITEPEVKDGKAENTTALLFNNGDGLKQLKTGPLQEHIQRTIFYKFDSTVIDKDGEAILNNVLKFLLEHKDSTINLSGYACVIGKENYNKGLSQKRSDIVKKFFADGGLDPQRIISTGKGEVDPTDDKMGRDNIKYKDEKEYENNRRVDISFVFNAHDAQTIMYELVAPSISDKKELTVDVIGFDTKICFRDSKHKHKKEIYVVDVGQAIDAGDTKKVFTTPSFNYSVYSDLSQFTALPIRYLWPAGTNPNQFHLHVHSCRYYSNEKRTTVLMKVYPDIKWTLSFTLNLTNDLSVTWMNMDPHEHKELQKRAGKMGAEKRWKQKDASLGFSLKAKWNNDKQEDEFKYEYETKFKKIYDTFASIGAVSDGITSQAKGKVRSISPKGIPVSFAVKPPNLELSGNWLLKHPKDNNKILGTEVAIGLKASPLIGLEMTVDLLGALVFGISGAVSGGTAAPGVTRLYQEIQGKLKSGIDVGNDNAGFKASVDIFMDLIISSIIEVESEFKFNTAGKLKDSDFKISAKSKLKVELKVGVKIQGEVSLAIIKAEAYFEASASGSASVTFGHGINYDEKGLYYRPALGFDGLDAQYLVTISVGLAIKIAKNKHKVEESRNGKYEIAKGEYKNVIPPFDVIKELESYFGMDANIPIIKND